MNISWFRSLLFFCIASAGIRYIYPQIPNSEPLSAVWEQTGYALGPMALSWAIYARHPMTIKNNSKKIGGWLIFLILLGLLFHFRTALG